MKVFQASRSELCKTLTLPEKKTNKAVHRIAHVMKNIVPTIDHVFIFRIEIPCCVGSLFCVLLYLDIIREGIESNEDLAYK